MNGHFSFFQITAKYGSDIHLDIIQMLAFQKYSYSLKLASYNKINIENIVTQYRKTIFNR